MKFSIIALIAFASYSSAATIYNIALGVTQINYADPSKNYTSEMTATSTTGNSQVILIAIGFDPILPAADQGDILSFIPSLTYNLGNSAAGVFFPGKAFDFYTVTADSYGALNSVSPISLQSYVQERYEAGDRMVYVEFRAATQDLEIVSTTGGIINGSGSPTGSISYQPIPEPASITMLLSAIAGTTLRRRRRNP